MLYIGRRAVYGEGSAEILRVTEGGANVMKRGAPLIAQPERGKLRLSAGRSKTQHAYISRNVRHTTLEATHGQILSQFPTDATRFWWHLYGS